MLPEMKRENDYDDRESDASFPKAELTAGRREGAVNNNQSICYRRNDVLVLGYVE